MNLESIQREIQTHLEAAYGLLPSSLSSAQSELDEKALEHLQYRYEHKDWYLLFASLQVYGSHNHFSNELLVHLNAVEELFGVKDHLGMRTALEQLTEEEKDIIGK